jgi:hypothetical protein
MHFLLHGLENLRQPSDRAPVALLHVPKRQPASNKKRSVRCWLATEGMLAFIDKVLDRTCFCYAVDGGDPIATRLNQYLTPADLCRLGLTCKELADFFVGGLNVERDTLSRRSGFNDGTRYWHMGRSLRVDPEHGCWTFPRSDHRHDLVLHYRKYVWFGGVVRELLHWHNEKAQEIWKHLPIVNRVYLPPSWRQRERSWPDADEIWRWVSHCTRNPIRCMNPSHSKLIDLPSAAERVTFTPSPSHRPWSREKRAYCLLQFKEIGGGRKSISELARELHCDKDNLRKRYKKFISENPEQ